jgi:uncharacterized protein
MPQWPATFRAAHRAALFSFIVLIAGLVGASGSRADMRHDTLTIITGAGERKFDIEVAVTPEEQARGLMFRTSLADTAGMLFPYNPARELEMWMKNTYIPLDMVFIRADGTILRIEERTEPLSETIIASQGAAAAVLELAGGATSRLGVKPGDRTVYNSTAKK